MKKVIKTLYILAFLIAMLMQNQSTVFAQRKSSYVKPYITRKGKIVSGHYRKSYSTSPNVFKNRARSRYYYHTKGKYTRRRK